MERGPVPSLLRIGLLVTAILLVGFYMAPGCIGSSHASGSYPDSPSTSQMEMLQEQATLSNPLESGKSQLGPEATVGQTAAMLASELLLDTGSFSLDMPLIVR
jgi:hypothetical protein